jgi:hypothetical protein
MKIKTLYTCCEQVGRGGKDYETKQGISVAIFLVKPVRNW